MKSSPLLDDLLSLGGSLFGNLAEARHDLKAQAKNRIDGLAQKLDLVTRDEFDAAFAMLAKARATQDDLAERIARIEKHLKLSPVKKQTAPPRKKIKKKR